MQQQPPASAPTTGPRPAFARPLPPNAGSFTSPSSSPPASASGSPAGSPMPPRPLPSLVRRQQSFSSSHSPPASAAGGPAPQLSLSSSLSTTSATSSTTGAGHVTRPLAPLPRVPSSDLPPTPSPGSTPPAAAAAGDAPSSEATSTVSLPASSTSTQPQQLVSPRQGSTIAGKSPRRPPNLLSPRGPLPPTPPGGTLPPSPPPSAAGAALASSSSSATVAPVATSPRGDTAQPAAGEGEGEWPTTSSQRHTPHIAPTLVAPFVPPPTGATAATPSPSPAEPATPADVVPGTRDEELLKLLTRDEGKVMMALLSALEFGDMDKITRAAVEYFVAVEPQDPNHPLLLRLLNALIFSEITDTEDPTTLFRSNTNGSKMLSACLRICGTPYLKNAIGPTIARVCRDTPAVEIDPERASSPDEAAANVTNLYALCEAFLVAILSSVDSCPTFIRRIFAHLQEAATLRFPDNKQITASYSIVGGFIFLRFFCSAIFSPFGFGVAAEQPKPEAMRAFVLVSKVLQMIANGLSFSDKTSEAYMRDMNPFLDAHQSDVVAFFRAVATVPEGEQAADVSVSDGEIVAPAAALAATDALHAGLHKYSAALATALGSDADAGAALAAFLAAFPPPARPPAGGTKSASSSPSVSPVITERAEPSPIKKKGGLGFAGAAGKRATTIMSTLRGGHDKQKEKEEKKEREREREKELHQQKEDEGGAHSSSPPHTPTLLSARRKEEGGTLHDLKALLVQLRDIKSSVEKEISGVEQQILDIISGQVPAESVTLSASTLALLAASKPQPPPATPEATSAALSEKERRRAEKERERREKEEREREKREKREREKEEKKEERRSRRLSMDAQSANVLKRRTVNLNSDEFSKDFAKFSEAFGGAMKFNGSRSSGSRASGGGSRTGSRSGSGSGNDIARPNALAASDAAGSVDPLDTLGAAESSPLKSVSAPVLEPPQPATAPTEQDALSFYAGGAEKRGSPLGHRASLAVSGFGPEKRLVYPGGLDAARTDELSLSEIAERAALPSSGLVKDRKQKLRTHKNCFVGSEFVDWLVVNRRAKTRAEGVNLAQQMFLQKLIVPVQSSDSQFEDKKGLYRFSAGGDGNFSPVSSPTVAPHEPFPEDDGDEELDQLYPHMVAEIEVKSRKDFENKTHKNCFVATQAVDWLMKNRHRAMTNDQALELAEKLRQKGYIKWVGRKTKKISISGPMSSPQAVAAATSVAGPPFEDDDSYYVFEKKSTNRASKRGK